MQFDFDVARACGVPTSNGCPTIARVEEAALQHPRWGECLRTVLDAVGERSRRAQGLGKAVTSSRAALLASNNVYLLIDGRVVLGLLKTGPKKLFVAKGMNDGLVEITPQCVLDFYVVEGKQRAGLGRKLFDAMLMQESVVPEKLAYDRPSPKLLGFLRKHFGLSRYVPQANNFVVFDAYFSGHHRASSGSRSRPSQVRTSEPSSVRVDLRDLDAARHPVYAQESRSTPPPANAAAAEALTGEPQEELAAAGMPSGGCRRASGPTAPLGGRRSTGNCGNQYDSPVHHAGRSALRPAHLRT